MNKVAQITKLSFFAAANGYSGFRNYFNKIFNPDEYSAIYILKGGPGTGKSSFMKRLLLELEPLVDECEAIYCSSDPISLDGVIIKKGGHSAAVIDGTAPHASDPVFPGAVDKILNLGEGWDENILEDNRSVIMELGHSKSQAYKYAYEYLGIAGEITQLVDNTLKQFYEERDKTIITSLLSGSLADRAKAKIRLITSYGKNGFHNLDTLGQITSNIYNVVGVYGSEYIFMSRLVEALNYSGVVFTLFPDALDGRKTHAVYIPSIGLGVTTARPISLSNERVIDTSLFLNQRLLSTEKDRLEYLWQERESMLWSSTEQFKRASDEHFKLEKIYSSAMDFSKNDELYLKCVADIRKKLLL